MRYLNNGVRVCVREDKTGAHMDGQRPNHQTPSTSCLLSTGDPASSFTPARVKDKREQVSDRGSPGTTRTG